MTFLLRTAGDPWTFVERAREAVAAAEPMIPIANMATMRAYLRNRIVEQGSFVGVIAVFGSMATLLAALGIYGVVAHNVARQRREIGIRMALGAPTAEIVRVVAHPVLVAMGAGLALGLAASLIGARLIATQLWDVPATDMATFSMVSMLLAGVGVLACAAPVRKALRSWDLRILGSQDLKILKS